MNFSLVSGHVLLHEWSEPLLVDHVVTLLVDLRDARNAQWDRPILILIIGGSVLAGTAAGDMFVTALPAILNGCCELVVVAEATDARSGTLRSVLAERRACENARAVARHFPSIDEALRHVENVVPHDILDLWRQTLRRSLHPGSTNE